MNNNNVRLNDVYGLLRNPAKTTLGESKLPDFVKEIDTFFDDASVMIMTIAILIMIGYMSSK